MNAVCCVNKDNTDTQLVYDITMIRFVQRNKFTTTADLHTQMRYLLIHVVKYLLSGRHFMTLYSRRHARRLSQSHLAYRKSLAMKPPKNVRAIEVNGSVGQVGSNCRAVAMQFAEAVYSPKVSKTLPNENLSKFLILLQCKVDVVPDKKKNRRVVHQILGQFGSSLAASFNNFSARRGSHSIL
uniref:Uncharacterized protein n=1 Tax=Glossina palpalis gambiensis TaxID=67801 RepID=A0A1B0BJD9_9MUSC